jgi:hypothetical protein
MHLRCMPHVGHLIMHWVQVTPQIPPDDMRDDTLASR